MKVEISQGGMMPDVKAVENQNAYFYHPSNDRMIEIILMPE